uniref:Extracellular calcium-sensing receptor-like n=1 Tax=Callorhinchus milii TaxID=7868 RepID=A0A4W3HJE1_CALMI
MYVGNMFFFFLLELLRLEAGWGSGEHSCKLQGKFDLPELSKDGDIILGGLFNLHMDRVENVHSFTVRPKAEQCKRFDFRGFRLAQTMIFAIEEINRNHLLLPNVTLGFRIHDDCASSKIVTKAALALVNGQETGLGYSCTGQSNVIGIVGTQGSSESIAVARVIGPFQVPMVSYFSTCTCLSSIEEYPTFFRTIPSDSHQSKLLAQLVQMFGWTWIGTVSSNNDYGRFGIQAFLEAVQKLGVCIAYSESFYRTDSVEKIAKVVDTIKKGSTKVVVALVSPGDMLFLLKEVVRQNVSDIQWLGSEAWVTAELLPSWQSTRFLVGTIGPAIPRFHISGLREYLLKVHPSLFPDNILVYEFWETMFKCILREDHSKTRSNTEAPIHRCTTNENLEEKSSTYSDITLDGSSYNVYKAVYVYAHALHNMLLCSEGKEQKNNKTLFLPLLLDFIRLVNFTTRTGDRVNFDNNGDPVATYDLINWKINVNGSAEIVKVGYYNGAAPSGQQLTLDEEHVMWSSGSNKVPQAVCSERCQPGSRKTVRKGQPICCFDCTQCADGEINSLFCLKCPWEYWSNERRDECIPKKIEFLTFDENIGIALTSLAIVGVGLTVAIAAVFFQYKDTPIVKSNNSELSFLLLFALALCFLCSLTFIGQPSVWSCMLRRTSFGISFVLCISCVLGKTIIVLMAFKTKFPNNNRVKLFGLGRQRFSIFALTFIQILLCALWLSQAAPFPLKNGNYYRNIIILECDAGSTTIFYCVSGYIALLSCVSFILAYLARKLPDNFNEAKYITFSMLIVCAVWVTFIPAYVSSPGKYTVAVEMFAILASSFGLLVCIFAPKCYVVLLKPECNTKKHIMGKVPSPKS